MLARIRKAMKEKDQGFTLIELLVVMIIIGILAAIAIPVFLNQKTKAVDTGLKSDLKTAADQIETASVDSGVYEATGKTGITGYTALVTAGTAYAAVYGKVGTKTSTTPILDSTFRTSDAGTTISYYGAADNKSFCLVASNAKSTATSGAYYIYSSQNGGLQASVVTTKTVPAGC